MASPPAIVLVAHGSPDPDWRRPLEQVRDQLRRLAADRPVALAYQGHTPPDLEAVVASLVADGCAEAVVLAAFISPGGNHIKRDLPELVARVQAAHPEIALHLVPGALGSDPGVVEALAEAAVRAAAQSSSR